MNLNNLTALETRQTIEAHKIVAVLRGDFAEAWGAIGHALVDGGVIAIEVTFGCPDALGGMRTLHDQFGGRALIGAGTVTSVEQVDQAVEAGARYIVAPNTNPDVIARCIEHGVLAIPGAFTPTEIELAWRLGAGMVKLFPSIPIGPDYLRNIRGPLPHIPIICTGGITPQNMLEFFRAGANAVGMVGSLVSADVVQPGGFDRLRDKAAHITGMIKSFGG